MANGMFPSRKKRSFIQNISTVNFNVKEVNLYV